ncbi:MAG: FadR family transcriptional regulator [Actinobacteria bacterium]|nr:FadR family transcriptional regulator [Actinomycetota bacterium]
MARKVHEGGLVAVASEVIRNLILAGELGSGDRLPAERELVKKIGVSRTVLREALSSLEALGMIESRGTLGRFVSPVGSPEKSRLIVASWLHNHAPELLEIDEIRSVLEGYLLRVMTDWDAIDASRKASTILREQERAIERDDPIAAAEADAEFHRLLCSYTPNTALRGLLDGLIEGSQRGALAVYSIPDAARRSLNQHQGIVQALAVSDIDRAVELAREHMVDAARRYSEREVDTQLGRGVTPPLLDSTAPLHAKV